MKYKIILEGEWEIEADSEEEAQDELFNKWEKENESHGGILCNSMMIIPENDKDNKIALIGRRE